MTEITTHEQLAEMMEFDCPVRVKDGVAIRNFTVSGPTLEMFPSEETPGLWEEDFMLGDWKLMTGYSGQQSYSGPVMHASEYIGGGMASAILDQDGLYVAVTVESACGYNGTTDCDEETGCNCEPAGWAVAYIAD